MTISNFVAYVKQAWKNKPDTSTPLSAPRLLHMEDGIKMTSDAIEKIAAAVVSQIVNDPNKIASMAALYAVDQKIGNVANLPNSAADVVTAITQQNSNLETANITLGNIKTVVDKLVYSSFEKTSVKISANSYISVEFDIAKDGYEPIGMVGFTVVNSTCIVNRAMFAASSNTATIGIRNNTSSDTETTVRASILYKGK